jgi:hypothetical protein
MRGEAAGDAVAAGFAGSCGAGAAGGVMHPACMSTASVTAVLIQGTVMVFTCG